jgi:flagellin
MFQSVSRLSSGLILNTAKDDAAAMVIRDLLRADIATAQQSRRNINDAVSMIQTADGAAGAISDNLVRMNQLAMQASSGIYSDQQVTIMQDEFNQLAELNTQITQNTTFNDIQLLEQSGPPLTISIGEGQFIDIARPGNIDVGPVDLLGDPQAAMAAIGSAFSNLSSYRSNIGATANMLESTGSVLDTRVENLLASESRISDVDVAREITTLTANEVLLKTAIAVQSHSNLMADELNTLLN